MAKYSLNEVLKQREAQKSPETVNPDEVKLDDVTRVKVLSPTRQVMKRFLRNRLAIVGSVILISMFVFCFIGPIFYAYGQKDTFHKYNSQNVNYALAKVNVNYNGYVVDDSVEFDISETNAMNTRVKSMIEDGLDNLLVVGDKGACLIEKLNDTIYTLNRADVKEICTIGGSSVKIGTYDLLTTELVYENGVEEISGLKAALSKEIGKSAKSGEVEFGGVTYTYEKDKGKRFNITSYDEGINYAGAPMDEAFETALTSAAATGESFTFDGKEYVLASEKEGVYDVYQFNGSKVGMVYSILTFDAFETGKNISDEFRASALMAAAGDGSFTVDGTDYTIQAEGDLLTVRLADGTEFGEFGPMSIRRYSGADSMDYQLKKDIATAIANMNASGEKSAELVADLPQQDADGQYVYDEEKNLLYSESDLRITQRNTGEYVINCDQVIYVIDTYAAPSWKHLLGTDGDGMDVLARIMYGGRVSLMVGFVVVIIETILGVIMGGISGYFGGWVDTVIMRLVDIFYCLPSMPIMIIIGAMMDAVRMDPYKRLMILMAALGVMGWASVARLVRGQILSLREQEFMVATEATGVKVRARIFRHLVPNVMPQLIVTATMGLGGVILTESTLSFLGLGVKHPMATWGTMINSVSSASAMAHYAHIWIPVGLLICLTVIAFNFVGDGLRDAYDPRAKR